MAFASELCKLCYKLLVGDQVVASAVNDIDPDADGPSNASLSFEQYDVIIPRQRMEAFDIAIMTERGPFTDDVGSFMECSFHDKQIQGKNISHFYNSKLLLQSFLPVFTFILMKKTWEKYPR